MPIRFIVLAAVLAEIAASIVVGKAIGVLPTLALTLLATVTGTALLRRQGIAALRRMRSEAVSGRGPARPLADGAVRAFAALLLILPGFLSDVVGVLLLIPAVRSLLLRRLAGAVQVRTFDLRGRRPSPATIELDARDYAAGPRRESSWRHVGRQT